MQKRLKLIQDKYKAGTLFGLCWLVYFASYIGRLNYSSAMPELIKDTVLTSSEAGFISMAYFFAYGAGQFLNGILADRIRPDKMIFCGLFGSGVVNMLMGLMEDFRPMAAFWLINGYLQAMIWPAVIKIFANMMEKERQMKCCVNIVSTMPAGTLASYLISAGMLAMFTWKYVFFGAAVCMCMAAVIFKIGFSQVENYSDKYGKDTGKYELDTDKDKNKQGAFRDILISSGLIFILVPVVVHGVLKDGMTSWVPTYISETFRASSTVSILVTMILPIVNLTGAYAAQYMYARFFKKNEVKTSAFFFAVAVGVLLLLWKFGDVNMVLTALFLAVITASMMAVNTLFVNLLPLRFEKEGRVSSVSGFLNSMAYFGCAVSTYGIGIMVQKTGWNFTILSWIILTLAGMIFCLIFRNMNFKKKESIRHG